MDGLRVDRLPVRSCLVIRKSIKEGSLESGGIGRQTRRIWIGRFAWEWVSGFWWRRRRFWRVRALRAPLRSGFLYARFEAETKVSFAGMFGVWVPIIVTLPSLARPVFSHLLGFLVVLVDLVLQAREDGVVFIVGGKAIEDLPLTLCYRGHIVGTVVDGWHIAARSVLSHVQIVSECSKHVTGM
jgi:hypothetical protein